MTEELDSSLRALVKENLRMFKNSLRYWLIIQLKKNFIKKEKKIINVFATRLMYMHGQPSILE